MIKTIALYLRISKEEEKEGESSSIEHQRELIYEYIHNKKEFTDWNIEEYQDDGWSGTTFHRPSFQRMLQLAGGSIHCIIVKDFSRFGRNLIEVGNYLDNIFPFLGVRFISVNDNYDSDNNNGKTVGLDISLKAFASELYSRDLSQKIKSVGKMKRQHGEHINGIPLYGYQKSSDLKNKLEIDEEAARIVRRIFQLALEGKKPSQIAIKLNKDGILPPILYRMKKYPNIKENSHIIKNINLWTRESVRRIITNKQYTGYMIGGVHTSSDVLPIGKRKKVPKDAWVVIKKNHDSIISEEIYQKAQKVIRHKNNKGDQTNISSKDNLQGLLKCGYCGHTLRKYPLQEPIYICPMGKYDSNSMCQNVAFSKGKVLEAIRLSLESQCKILHDENVSLEKHNMIMNPFLHKWKDLDQKIWKDHTKRILLFEKFAEGKVSKEKYQMIKQELSISIDDNTQEQAILKENLEKEQDDSFHKEVGYFSFLKNLPNDVLKKWIQEILCYSDTRFEMIYNFKENDFL